MQERSPRVSHPHDRLRSNHPLAAISLRAGVSHVIMLAAETDNEHGSSVPIADRLIGRDDRRVFTSRCGVAGALAEAAAAKLLGAAKKLNAIVGVVRSKHRLHRPEMLIAKRQKIRAHAKRV